MHPCASSGALTTEHPITGHSVNPDTCNNPQPSTLHLLLLAPPVAAMATTIPSIACLGVIGRNVREATLISNDPRKAAKLIHRTTPSTRPFSPRTTLPPTRSAPSARPSNSPSFSRAPSTSLSYAPAKTLPPARDSRETLVCSTPSTTASPPTVSRPTRACASSWSSTCAGGDSIPRLPRRWRRVVVGGGQGMRRGFWLGRGARRRDCARAR